MFRPASATATARIRPPPLGAAPTLPCSRLRRRAGSAPPACAGRPAARGRAAGQSPARRAPLQSLACASQLHKLRSGPRGRACAAFPVCSPRPAHVAPAPAAPHASRGAAEAPGRRPTPARCRRPARTCGGRGVVGRGEARSLAVHYQRGMGSRLRARKSAERESNLLLGP